MATLNPVIVPAKVLKGGRHKIRISIAHNGETRYIPTDIIIDNAKEFKAGRIVKRPDAAILNTKLRGIIQRYQDTIDGLNYIDGLNCAELVCQIKTSGIQNHRTLLSIYEEYLSFARLKPRTLIFNRSKWNILSGVVNPNMLVENITSAAVLKFDQSLRRRGLSQSTIWNYMSFFKMLLNYAEKHGYVAFKVSPFLPYKMPAPEVRDAWLSVEEIKRIRDIDDAKMKKCTRRYRDFFLLSYYLGGINMEDLKKINFDESDEIRYVRSKTETSSKINKYVQFKIPEEALTIVNRYKGENGLLNLSSWQYRSNCSEKFAYHLGRIAELAGVKKFIYYSARKSFAQHAFDLGVRESVIDYILGHKLGKGGSSLYSYMFVTPEMATAAIRKVLDNLK